MPMTWAKASLLLGVSVWFVAVPALAQLIGPPSIPGAPYSAVQETEHTQTLGDGTHIVTKSRQRLYRDSSGRTRREMFVGFIGMPPKDPTEIVISDPVAGKRYRLLVQQRVAQLQAPLLRKAPIKPAVAPVAPPQLPEQLRPKIS